MLLINPGDIAPPNTAILHVGLWFSPKDELHVTLIGKQQASRLNDLGLAELVAPILQRLPNHWPIGSLGRWYLLKEPQWAPTEAPERQGRASIIELVQCRQGERFFAELSRQAGQQLPAPPFHITHFVHADRHGIAVPDLQFLQRVGTALAEKPI